MRLPQKVLFRKLTKIYHLNRVQPNCLRDPGLIPGSERSPGKGNGYPLVFLPGEIHGQKSLAGFSPWGHKEPDVTVGLTHF